MDDVLLLTGDPHVDHPAFPASLIGRWLEAHGFRVTLLARPEPDAPELLRRMGRPRLFVGVTAGALDSMVANTTALRKRRSDDPYSPDGAGPLRPDRALTVYCNLARKAFGKSTLIVAGGLEASLRRFAHYDYWSDSIRRPILMDCGADLLVFGMGEETALELAVRIRDRLAASSAPGREELLQSLRDVPGIVWRQPRSAAPPADGLELPSAEAAAADKRTFALTFQLQERNRGARMWQACAGLRIVANTPRPAPTMETLDRIYALPFSRNPHPRYGGRPIPALEQVRFSVTTHRGCCGGCAFCALGLHQGKEIASRSPASILDELRRIVAHPEFRGTVPDLGGPTANMFGTRCAAAGGGPIRCGRPSCLWPSRCGQLEGGQERYLELLRKASAVPGVKHLFVTTGIRMDLANTCPELLRELAFHHTSGHLKVAPEHLVPAVLELMRKPAGSFEAFLDEHRRLSAEAGKEQFVLPYFMAAHPGCRLEDMVEAALFLKRRGIVVEQCQIFTPTPGTAASVMYATGLRPDTLEAVFVERSDQGKRLQKALLLRHLPASRPLVKKALRLCRRDGLDL